MRRIQVKVKPGARTSTFEPATDGTWIATIKSPPIDGRANAELVDLVARHFECARSAVSIKGGASGRMKWVEVND